MSKDSLHEINKPLQSIPFAEFWHFIAGELGDSRLELNTDARSINQLFSAASDHRDFLKEVVCQSYRRSRCYHLFAPIDVNAVLDVLGETAHKLQGKNNDDLLDIELLEEICFLTSERYATYIAIPTPSVTRPYKLSSEPATDRAKSEVKSFSRARIRRANQKQI